MTFHDFTVSAQGDLVSQRIHDSQTLVPDAVEVFARMLCEHGRSFRVAIPFADFGQWNKDLERYSEDAPEVEWLSEEDQQ